MTARISPFGVTTSRSAVGVMVRGSLDVDSSFAAMFLEARAAGLDPGGAFRFRHRPQKGERARSMGGDRPPTTESWVRIERRGESLRGETSSDGETWTFVDQKIVSDR